MRDRLQELLGANHRVRQWRQTPIEEWRGFTVEDMEHLGFWTEVQDWFNQLTDKQILAIAKRKPLLLHSSPVYK